MTAVQQRSRAGRRLVRRVLEGDRPWGDLVVSATRYGYVRHVLVVYPPGTDRQQRIRLRLLRAWPLPGALLALVLTVVLAQSLAALPAVLGGAALFLTGAAVLARAAGPARKRVRTIRTCLGSGASSGLDRGDHVRLAAAAAFLLESDRLLEDGAIDAVRHELAWGEAWELLQDESRL